jgi:uncharacterized cupin superfamily protein
MNTRIHPIKLGVDHCYVIQGEGTIVIDDGSPDAVAASQIGMMLHGWSLASGNE